VTEPADVKSAQHRKRCPHTRGRYYQYQEASDKSKQVIEHKMLKEVVIYNSVDGKKTFKKQREHKAVPAHHKL
jgi:hypothetical protein